MQTKSATERNSILFSMEIELRVKKKKSRHFQFKYMLIAKLYTLGSSLNSKYKIIKFAMYQKSLGLILKRLEDQKLFMFQLFMYVLRFGGENLFQGIFLLINCLKIYFLILILHLQELQVTLPVLVMIFWLPLLEKQVP